MTDDYPLVHIAIPSKIVGDLMKASRNRNEANDPLYSHELDGTSSCEMRRLLRMAIFGRVIMSAECAEPRIEPTTTVQLSYKTASREELVKLPAPE